MTDRERELRLRFMNGLIHRAAGNEKKDEGKALEWLDQPDRPDLRLTLTPQQNTVLHIAVRFNQEDLATKIIELCPPLLYERNSKGDIPLHIAAKAGHLDVARLLTTEAGAPGDMEEGATQRVPGEMLGMTNWEGNTPLHEALKMGDEKMALCLLVHDKEEELGGIVNYAKESPLYLAVAASLKHVVVELLDRRNCSIEGPDSQTPLHIAVIDGRSKRGLGSDRERGLVRSHIAKRLGLYMFTPVSLVRCVMELNGLREQNHEVWVMNGAPFRPINIISKLRAAFL